MDIFDFKFRPKVAWLTVNRECNFRCVWCYGKDTNYDYSETMDLELAQELVDIGIGLGVDFFDIIGGEPTLWEHLAGLNSYCHDKGVKTCLVTNASRFGNDIFWNEYKKNPCDEISISIKCSDSDFFKDVTGVNLYEQTMIGIKRALELYPDTGVSTVFNSLLGTSGLKEIAIACKNAGAKSFIVDLCTPVIEGDKIQKGFSIEPKELANEIINLLPFLEDVYSGKIMFATYIPLCFFPKEFIERSIEKKLITTVCHVYGRSGVNFDINGDVIVCNQIYNSIVAKKGIDFSNSTELMNHLNSDAVMDDYKQLLRFPSIECSRCHWKTHCRGGCLLNWTLLDPSICHAVSTS